MSSKKGIKPLTLLLFVLLTVQTLMVPVHSQSATNSQDSYNVWTLEDWNIANTTQWWSQGKYVNATKNSDVTYNITSSQNNMTDPNSGYFSIGNVTNIKTDNADLASTFTLSIYPWYPGFVTNPTNWTENEDLATQAAAGTYLQGSLYISNNQTYNLYGYLRSAVEFSYVQNATLGNQNTTLMYDKATGVLLYAKSEIFFSSLYKIELALKSSTLIKASDVSNTTTSSSTTATSPGFTILLPLLVLPVLAYSKKRFRNH